MADAIDLSSLLMLRQLQKPGKPDAIARIVERFLDETPERLAALRSALDAADATALESAAHALKGIAGTIGANEMHDMARELELLGRSGTTRGAAELVTALEASLQRAVPVYERLRDDR